MSLGIIIIAGLCSGEERQAHISICTRVSSTQQNLSGELRKSRIDTRNTTYIIDEQAPANVSICSSQHSQVVQNSPDHATVHIP